MENHEEISKKTWNREEIMNSKQCLKIIRAVDADYIQKNMFQNCQKPGQVLAKSHDYKKKVSKLYKNVPSKIYKERELSQHRLIKKLEAQFEKNPDSICDC